LTESAEELLSFHDELDALSAEKDGVAATIVLVFLALVLFSMGLDNQLWWITLGSLVPGSGAVHQLRVDLRRVRRKRELKQLIESKVADQLSLPADGDSQPSGGAT
jgi:hypothetical protein